MNDYLFAILLIFLILSVVILYFLIKNSQHGSGHLKLGKAAELKFRFSHGRKHLKTTTRKHKSKEKNYHKRSRSSINSQINIAWLEIKGGNWQYSLSRKKKVYIGSDSKNHIQIKDSTVDARQAIIYQKLGRFRIRNTSSFIPTHVNGRPITEQNLGNGNTIRLGQTELIFRENCKS